MTNLNGTDGCNTIYLQDRVKSSESYTQNYRVQTRKGLHLVGESEKAREITFEMGLQRRTNFRQPKMKTERIPDKLVTVSQRTKKGKPGLLRTQRRGREKAGKVGWGPFSRNIHGEVIIIIRQPWICFRRFCALGEMVVNGKTLKMGDPLRSSLTGERIKACSARIYRIKSTRQRKGR